MAALTGNKIKDSYLGLLKSIDNAPFSPRASGTFVQISDGGGNSLPLYLSTTSINFYNAYTFPSADGTISGQVLSTDANGTLSWVTSSDNQTLAEVLGEGNTTSIAILSTASGNTFGSTTFSGVATLANNSIVSGTPPSVGNNSTKIATTAYVDTQVGTSVTSVALSVPTGLSVTGSPITTSGTLAMSYASGYSIPTDSKQTQWDTAYSNRITSAVVPLNLGSNQISLGTVGVNKGGTGATTLTGILLGNGTSAISGITSAVDGNVLTADGNGGYAFEVSSGDVSISGTPTANQIAIWTDGSTIKGMSALEISTDGTITLSQPNSDDPIVVTNSYNIGGGNIANVTGYNNTGFGNRSLFNVTTGSNNVGLGSLSMQNLTTASSNTAIGNSSMSNDTITGSNNVAIGDQSLLNLQSGSSNVAIGVATMANNDMTGTANVAIGYQSLKDVSSGGGNVAIGYQSLKTNQNQNDNVAIGSSSMLSNTGNKNIAIGTNTLYASGFTISNVAIGHESLKDVTTGSRNTAIGYYSGTDNITGLNNTFIGYQSGYQMTSGNNNVIIGSFGGSTINGSSNNIIISDGDGNNRIQVDSGGNVGIGTTPTDYYIGADNLVVKQASGEGGITIVTADNTNGALYFADGTTDDEAYRGGIYYDHDNDVLNLTTAGTSKFNISSTGLATFNSSVGATIKINTTDAVNNYISFQKSGTDFGYLGTGSSIVPSFVTGDVALRSEAALKLCNGNNAALTITSTGNVLVGLANPATNVGKFEIETASAIAYNPTANITGTNLRLATGGTAATNVTTGISMGIGGNAEAYIGAVQNSSGYADIVFQSYSGSYSEKMRISSGGTVSILSGSNPDLDVKGTVIIRGNSSAHTTHYLTTAAANVAKYNMLDASGNIKNSFSAGGNSYITGGDVYIGNSSISTAQTAIFLQKSGIITNVYAYSSGSITLMEFYKQSAGIIGTISYNGTDTLYNATSDYRLKEDLKDYNGIDFISKIKTYNFKWKNTDIRSYGVMAHELQEVFPNCVTGEKDALDDNGEIIPQGVDYSKIVPMLTKAIQEQQTIIEDLKSRIEKLEL